MPPWKRPKETPQTLEEGVEEDRISDLPDSILLHILSLLPTTKDAILATATLSKRWRFLWTSVPVLLFRERRSWHDDVLLKFISFVDRALLLYRPSTVMKFYLDFNYKKRHNSKVDTWVQFATNHNVEELVLYLQFYALPEFLFRNDTIKTLNLRSCDIAPNGVIHWRSLTSLSFTSVRLSDPLIENILSGCPVLECLVFCHCGGFSSVDATSSRLRKLVIDGVWRDDSYADDCASLEILGPNLLSLYLLGRWHNNQCRVRNASSLVDATLTFHLFPDSRLPNCQENAIDIYCNMLRETLENIHHVKKLTLGNWCMEVVALCKLKALPSPLRKNNYLAVDTCFYPEDLPGIESLLRSSPDLQTLCVNMIPSQYDKIMLYCSEFFGFDGVKYWTSQNTGFKDLLLNLKTVKIVGFGAKSYSAFPDSFGAELNSTIINNMLDFVEFILRDASLLEKMVIYTKHHVPLHRPCADWADIYDACQRLLSFPRSSPHVQIILRNM